MTGGDEKTTTAGEGSGKGQMVVSPYYLHPSDNHGSLISPVQLRVENYEEWARSLRNSLRAKKKLRFIDGTLEKPADDSSEMEDWWMVNSMLVAWIFDTIEPSLRSTITYMENVKHLWDDLHQRFSIGNGPRVHQLKADLAACKQQGQAVVAYYERLKMMWDELVNYEPIPSCKCSGCKYDISEILEKKRDEEKVHQFLMGLDDVVYGTVRSNILSMEPLPNINRAYAMIIQEERHRSIARSGDERRDVVGFAAQLRSNTKIMAVRGKEKQGLCGHCGKHGHDAKTCYQIVGYPEWWGDRARTSDRGPIRGRGAGQFGRGKGGDARVNVTRMSSETEAQRHGTHSDSDPRAFTGLSGDQWATLLEMINENKDGMERLSCNTPRVPNTIIKPLVT